MLCASEMFFCSIPDLTSLVSIIDTPSLKRTISRQVRKDFNAVLSNIIINLIINSPDMFFSRQGVIELEIIISNPTGYLTDELPGFCLPVTLPFFFLSYEIVPRGMVVLSEYLNCTAVPILMRLISLDNNGTRFSINTCTRLMQPSLYLAAAGIV